MTNRQARTMLMVICSLLLAGCSGVPFVNNRTPEEVALQEGAMLVNGTQLQPHIAGKRQLPNGKTIVLYRADMTEANGQATHMIGYSLVQRQGLGWSSQGNGSSGGGPKPDAAQLINMGYGGGSNGRQNFTIMYGETLTPDVVAVEATLDNGQTLRDSAADGVFVVYSDNANAVCSMRVLGANDAVLQTNILNTPAAPGQAAMGLPNKCPQP